jgi:hypothetical protein
MSIHYQKGGASATFLCIFRWSFSNDCFEVFIVQKFFVVTFLPIIREDYVLLYE